MFWIVDNGSSHRGQAAKERLAQLDRRIILVHTLVHASWLNQVEIYFSIIQRKVLTPNDFADLNTLRLRLILYEELYNQNPTLFQWKFDQQQLKALLAKIERHDQILADAQNARLDKVAQPGHHLWYGALRNSDHQPNRNRSSADSRGARWRERQATSSCCFNSRFSATIARTPPGCSS